MKNNWLKTVEILKKNGVVVLPTDTLYGIVGSAFSKKAVERIYKIKGRSEGKPFIVLINSEKQLKSFDINLPLPRGSGQRPRGSLSRPKVSIILPCQLNKFKYIHRGTNSIAFRMIGPRNKNLCSLISKVGPIVAPSANPEGQKPAETIRQAKKYFSDTIDLYINVGPKKSKPSTLISFLEEKPIILRS
jgi:L-threonylcarbamoyladenylate synthase